MIVWRLKYTIVAELWTKGDPSGNFQMPTLCCFFEKQQFGWCVVTNERSFKVLEVPTKVYEGTGRFWRREGSVWKMPKIPFPVDFTIVKTKPYKLCMVSLWFEEIKIRPFGVPKPNFGLIGLYVPVWSFNEIAATITPHQISSSSSNTNLRTILPIPPHHGSHFETSAHVSNVTSCQ